jgi:hypothetical protein
MFYTTFWRYLEELPKQERRAKLKAIVPKLERITKQMSAKQRVHGNITGNAKSKSKFYRKKIILRKKTLKNK